MIYFILLIHQFVFIQIHTIRSAL